MIIGANSGESIRSDPDILSDPDLLTEFNDNWETYGPIYIFEREEESDITEEDILVILVFASCLIQRCATSSLINVTKYSFQWKLRTITLPLTPSLSWISWTGSY